MSIRVGDLVVYEMSEGNGSPRWEHVDDGGFNTIADDWTDSQYGENWNIWHSGVVTRVNERTFVSKDRWNGVEYLWPIAHRSQADFPGFVAVLKEGT